MSSESGPVDNGPQLTHGKWPAENKIVIGIDIGATQSGAAFAYLIKGESAVLHRIRKWPGQAKGNENAKIPTVIWYDDKKAISFGADALSHEKKNEAQEKGWTLAQDFKLHLHPSRLRIEGLQLKKLDEKLPPLSQIYSDFLGYVFKQTKIDFEDRILDGKSIWEKYAPTMEVVLSHPNGWGASEQSFLRNAAVECNAFDSPQVQIANNIKFVTEAEASVHYCIQHSNLSTQLKAGSRFAVCDAGGSTVDTTLYSVVSAQPDFLLEEVRESASVQAGGIFVNRDFEARLSEWMRSLGLTGGEDEVDEYTEEGVQDFEFTKRNFDYDNKDPKAETNKVTIKVGGRRVSRSKPLAMCEIRRGYIEVPSSQIKGCFDKCVDPITSQMDHLLGALTVDYILLVGGFGDSPYLRSVFKNKYEKRAGQDVGSHEQNRNIRITLANESTSKAVADGAVYWSIIRSVVARAPHYSYGIICPRTCIPWMEELGGRRFSLGPGGLPIVLGAWSPIVRKGIPLDSDKVYRKTYSFTSQTENPESVTLSRDLHAYAGDDEPKWGLDNNGGLLASFHKVGEIEAHMVNLEGALEHNEGLIGGLEYWEMDVDICFQFGGTELHAWIEWKQNGITRTGSAKLVAWRPLN